MYIYVYSSKVTSGYSDPAGPLAPLPTWEYRIISRGLPQKHRGACRAYKEAEEREEIERERERGGKKLFSPFPAHPLIVRAVARRWSVFRTAVLPLIKMIGR